MREDRDGKEREESSKDRERKKRNVFMRGKIERRWKGRETSGEREEKWGWRKIFSTTHARETRRWREPSCTINYLLCKQAREEKDLADVVSIHISQN